MSNLGLVSYNKKFLYCAVRALGSNHDASMLRNSAIYQKIVTVNAIPERVIDRHAWLIKVFREDTSDRRENNLIRRYAVLASFVKMHWAC